MGVGQIIAVAMVDSEVAFRRANYEYKMESSKRKFLFDYAARVTTSFAKNATFMTKNRSINQ